MINNDIVSIGTMKIADFNSKADQLNQSSDYEFKYHSDSRMGDVLFYIEHSIENKKNCEPMTYRICISTSAELVNKMLSSSVREIVHCVHSSISNSTNGWVFIIIFKIGKECSSEFTKMIENKPLSEVVDILIKDREKAQKQPENKPEHNGKFEHNNKSEQVAVVEHKEESPLPISGDIVQKTEEKVLPVAASIDSIIQEELKGRRKK